MRTAALYDIHGNLPALEAVIEDVRSAQVDRIVVGGDVIPGPMPRQTLDALFALDMPLDFIYGNGERAVLAALAGEELVALPESVREGIRWTGEQLTPQQLDRIKLWPATVRLDVSGFGEVLFCHATPRDDNEIFTRLTEAQLLQPIFDPVGVSTVLCGHTHMQFDRMIGTTRVVNAGSVGMPFGSPGAYWVLLDTTVELRRTDYDLEAAAKRVLDSDYPGADMFAAGSVLKPPTEDAMLEVFERSALR